MPQSPLFDASGRRIRRPRYFGFGRTLATEPDPIRFDPDQAGAVCADAIGFMTDLDDAAEVDITRTKGTPCEKLLP